MDIFEITAYQSGVSREGVNFLQPSDSFVEIKDGFIYRQVLQSRKGFSLFAPRLGDESRITGIFEYIKPDGTKELLVTDMNFLYVFNTGTGVFDQIPFGGSMAAYGGFNITSNEDYISGTAYPFADNSERFVFTGKGISANAAGSSIFFYDGTDVLDYTAVADNADYVAPVGLTLIRAKHVIWFGERLNFFVPEFTATKESQGILFSGIRSSTGNGDKYNVAGAGLILLDTYEEISGSSILGDVISMNLTRSNWILEKTRDPFNPYTPRRIPSVIGTDADFSFTQWNGRVESVGKTGVVAMDENQSVRVDNKVPFFTRDEIDPEDFQLTYGGFDRDSAQFLFSYKETESDTATQNKILVNNYEESTWSVYNMRVSVFGQSDVGKEIVWNQIDGSIKDSWSRWDTTEEIWNKIGLTASTQKTLAGDDEGFIYQMNQDHDDYLVNISAITQASQAVLTVDESAFKPGDRVVVKNVEGMEEINNYDSSENEFIKSVYTVVSATNTAVTLNVDSTNFTAYSSDGTLSKLISFSAETNPFNPYRDKGRKCHISMIEFLLNTNGGSVTVDVFMDEENVPFIRDVLCKPTSVTREREWVEMSINQEANFFTFKLKFENPSFGVELPSTRIHANVGGLTNG